MYENTKIIIIENDELLERLYAFANKTNSNFFAFDLETDSAIPKYANLYGIGICFNTSYAFYIPWRKQPLAIDTEDDRLNRLMYWSEDKQKEILAWMDELVTNKNMVAHNGIYDILVWKYNTGQDWTDRIYADTILMKHTIDEEPPHGLKPTSVKYLGEDADKAQEDLKESVLANGGKWKKEQKDMYLADTKILGYYCCWDVLLTYDLFVFFSKKLREQNLEQLFYFDEIMPLYRKFTIPAKDKGFPVDLDLLNKTKHELEVLLADYEKSVVETLLPHAQQTFQNLMDENIDVKNSGNFPVKYAELAAIPLPVSKKGTITLAKGAIKKQKAATPEYSYFYDYLGEDFSESEQEFKEFDKQLKLKKTEYKTKGIDIRKNKDIKEANEKLKKLKLQRNIKLRNLTEQFLDADLVAKTQQELFKDKKDQKYLININSKDQLGILFFDVLGFEAKKISEKTGKPSLDSELLDELIEEKVKEYPFLEDLYTYRKLLKIYSTYIVGILERQIDGVIYADLLQFGTTSGRFSSRSPNLQNLSGHKELNDNDSEGERLIKKYTNIVRNVFIAPKGYKIVAADWCLHPDMEILTENGFKNVIDINTNEKVYQVNKDTLEGSYTVPSRIIQKDYDGPIYEFGNQRGSLKVTQNHRMLWVGQYHKTRADKEHYRLESLSNEGIPREGLNFAVGSVKENTFSNFSKKEIWKACLLQADANYVEEEDTYRIEVSKIRKRNKIRKLLGTEGKVSKSIRPCHTLITEKWRTKNDTPLLTKKNLLVEKIGSNQIDMFVEALVFWDGSLKEGKYLTWSNTDYNLVQRVQILLIKNNYEAKLSVVRHSNPKHKDLFCLKIKKRSRIRLRKCDYKVYNFKGTVGCVTVPEGYIVVRDKKSGQTFVTGNCQLEPRLFTHVTQDTNLIKAFNSGEDFYSRIAIDVLGLDEYSANPKDKNYLKKNSPKDRNRSKVFCLAIPYGAEAGRISKSMNIEFQEANDLINKYLNTYPGLKGMMKNARQMALIDGVSITEFGRIRHLEEATEIYKKYGKKILDYRYAKSKNLLKIRRKLKNLLNNSTNFKIQGMAAHVCNRAIIKLVDEINKEKLNAYPVLQIHDEIVCIAEESIVENFAKILQDSMENTVKVSVALPAEPIIADNLGEAK